MVVARVTFLQPATLYPYYLLILKLATYATLYLYIKLNNSTLYLLIEPNTRPFTSPFGDPLLICNLHLLNTCACKTLHQILYCGPPMHTLNQNIARSNKKPKRYHLSSSCSDDVVPATHILPSMQEYRTPMHIAKWSACKTVNQLIK